MAHSRPARSKSHKRTAPRRSKIHTGRAKLRIAKPAEDASKSTHQTSEPIATAAMREDDRTHKGTISKAATMLAIRIEKVGDYLDRVNLKDLRESTVGFLRNMVRKKAA